MIFDFKPRRQRQRQNVHICKSSNVRERKENNDDIRSGVVRRLSGQKTPLHACQRVLMLSLDLICCEKGSFASSFLRGSLKKEPNTRKHWGSERVEVGTKVPGHSLICLLCTIRFACSFLPRLHIWDLTRSRTHEVRCFRFRLESWLRSESFNLSPP